jgi:DNA-directed RNA polymerase
MDVAFEREINLEKEMMELGREAFNATVENARQKGREATTNYGRSLIAYALDAVESYLREWCAKARKAPMKDGSAYQILATYPLDVAAYLGLATAIDTISYEKSFVWSAIQVGTRMEDEARLRKLASENKSALKRALQRVDNAIHKRHIHMSISATLGRIDEEHPDTAWTHWSKEQKVTVGTVVLHAVCEATGYFKIVCKSKLNRATNYLIASDAAKEWINKQLDDPILRPQWLPTVCKPLPWTTPYDGGYLTHYVPNQTLLKTPKKHYLSELAENSEALERVYGAINALQETPWKINGRVLEVISTLWDLNAGCCGLPSREPQPLPRCPVCGEEVGGTGVKHKCLTDKDILIKWKREASRIYDANARYSSKRLQAMRVLWIAKKYLSEERIYFPHALDFRGRAYPIPALLHPQGTDLARGLLLFADGKPLDTPEALQWWYIQGANCFGVDKVSFEDRVKWIEEHRNHILASSDDPIGYRWWTDAEDPCQFLAFCFEYADRDKAPEGFLSYLPCAMDGTCNGLQHFSAMGRDPIGGAATNLVPHSKPADIYAVVANRTLDVLRELLDDPEASEEDKEQARKWLVFGLTRKTVKRPVMTLPYGSTQFSCRDYLEEAIQESISEGKEVPWKDEEIFKATVFLAKHVWAAIGLTLVAATKIQKYLQSMARVAAKENLPLTWTTPSGLPILQAYTKQASNVVQTLVNGRSYRVSVNSPIPELDPRRQASGVSPNFVHSLDAAAMTLTVFDAHAKGVSHFAMVHDSYATHAHDCPTLAASLRDVFVRLYEEHDVLQEFDTEIRGQIPESKWENLPDIPEKGALDLQLIRSSLYFFA